MNQEQIEKDQKKHIKEIKQCNSDYTLFYVKLNDDYFISQGSVTDKREDATLFTKKEALALLSIYTLARATPILKCRHNEYIVGKIIELCTKIVK